MKTSHLLGAVLCSVLALGTGFSPAQAASSDIKIVLPEEADLLEPCMATRSNIGRVIMENVSETLTELDVRGKQGVMPRLAEKWEQTGDGTWRFHLRQGVTFSDGKAFGAKDVKYSFDRIFSDKNICESRRYFGGMKFDVKIVDDTTIEIGPTTKLAFEGIGNAVTYTGDAPEILGDETDSGTGNTVTAG